MAGLAIAFVAAAIADLAGGAKTRPFTRRAFLLLVLLEAGVSVSGLASYGFDSFAVLAGVL